MGKFQKTGKNKCSGCRSWRPFADFLTDKGFKRQTCKYCRERPHIITGVNKNNPVFGLTSDDRFAYKIKLASMKKDNNECWEWPDAKDKNGYGYFRRDGITIKAHRESWRLYNQKEIPKGYCVCHSCDNPLCVNPKHLWLGTVQENNKDRHLKGRTCAPKSSRDGSKNWMAKLTEKDVFEIRELYSKGVYLQSELAKIYTVSDTCISSVIIRKTWRHI